MPHPQPRTAFFNTLPVVDKRAMESELRLGVPLGSLSSDTEAATGRGVVRATGYFQPLNSLRRPETTFFRNLLVVLSQVVNYFHHCLTVHFVVLGNLIHQR